MLQVCGSAANAFIILASSSGLRVRRLLLLNAGGSTTHVDTQVLLNGRWIIVDPAFRVMLRGPDGALLTAEQLKDPYFEWRHPGSRIILPDIRSSTLRISTLRGSLFSARSQERS